MAIPKAGQLLYQDFNDSFMAKITREDIDALNLKFTVEIAEADYVSALDKELKKYRQHAQLKGFRKGKTPMSAVRKMFGRQVFSQVINDQLQEAVNEFLSDDTLNYLGQPIPSADTPEIDLDVRTKGDYTFKFDLGLAPDFEVQGLADGHTFEYLKVVPGEDKIAEDLLNLRRRSASPTEVDSEVEESDIITVTGVELVGGLPKVDGITHDFTLFVRNTQEAVQQELIGKHVGDSVRVNVFELEKNTSEKHVRQYLLGLKEEDEREVSPDFELTIDKISRVIPREMDQAFFDEAFGEGKVTSEEEARAHIKEEYGSGYAKSADALLFRDMQEYLMEQNQLEFPEAFLKRWLVMSNDKNTEEGVEQEFANFAKGLQWTLIREKLVKHFELEVTPEELRAGFAEQVMGYFVASRPEWMDDSMIDNMVNRMMQDEKAVRERYDEVLTDKVAEALKEGYTLQEKEVNPDEMQQLIEEARAKFEAESALLDEEE
jgi:trigger factor